MESQSADCFDFSSAQRHRIVESGWLRSVDYAAEMLSTNDRALELLTSSMPATPFGVLTAQQTLGRGRGNHRWLAEPGALTSTIVIRPAEMKIPTDRIPRLSLAVGLAVCRLLSRWIPADRIGLKWPNDVYIRGRKICGILIEIPPISESNSANDPAALPGESCLPNRPILIGIGLNVNNSMATANPEIRDQSTSLVDLTGIRQPLPALFAELLVELDRVLDLLAHDEDSLTRDWQKFCLLTGRRIVLEQSGTLHSGDCLGISDNGGLLLREQSQTRIFYSGTIHSF